MSDLLNTLQQWGLTEKESRVFLVLLELKESLVSSISRKAGLKRPTTYVVLEQLKKKGLVNSHRKKNCEFYGAIEPSVFFEEQKKKFKKLSEALPELVNLHASYSVRPQVTLFEGAAGIIQVMEDTLTTKTELLSWGDVEEGITSKVLKDYYPSYVQKKIKLKIWLRGIFAYSSAALRFKKYGKQELREVYLISREKFPFKNEVIIYDDKMAIVSHEDEVGIIIQNKNIADTQRTIFNIGFEYSKLVEPKILNKKDLAYLKAKSLETDVNWPVQSK